jgi:molybdate transport repressor ModE-like protein
MIDPHRLRLLRDVAVHGTVTAAADHAGYTVSAVSQALSALSREMGTALLEKRGRNVVLTRAGEALVDSSSAVFEAIEAAEMAVAQAVGSMRGRVRLGSMASMFVALVPQVVLGLRADHPDVELEVVELNEDLRLELRRGNLDLAIDQEYSLLPPREMDEGIERFPLLEEPVFLVVADSVQVDSVEQLALEQWAFAPFGECSRATKAICAGLGIEPQPRFHSDNHGVLLPLAKIGAAVVILPAACCLPKPEGVRLLELEGVTRRVDLYARSSAAEMPVVIEIAARLRQAAEEIVPRLLTLADGKLAMS